MKLLSASVIPLALTIWSSPASADDTLRSTMSGTMTLHIVPKDKAATESEAGEAVTIRVVQPHRRESDARHDAQSELKRCGDKWNMKLQAYDKDRARRERYLAYSEALQRYPAQRPPKEPVLTRAGYRAYMYACLGDTTSQCPE